jgi:hypothetical protein
LESLPAILRRRSRSNVSLPYPNDVLTTPTQNSGSQIEIFPSPGVPNKKFGIESNIRRENSKPASGQASPQADLGVIPLTLRTSPLRHPSQAHALKDALTSRKEGRIVARCVDVSPIWSRTIVSS